MSIQSIIGAGNKTPGIFMQVSLGAGARSSGAAGKKVLLFGNKIAAGIAVAETPVAIGSKDDAITYFGAGSELALMCEAALDRFKFIQLFAVVVTETGAAAAGTRVFSGTATEANTFIFWIGAKKYTHTVSIGDTATVVGDAVALLVNNDTDSPVTAANVTGTVTLTAKNLGIRGNHIRLVSQGVVAGITHTTSATYLAGGTGQDDAQAALDAVAGTRYHYLVPASSVIAELTKFRTHVRTTAEPANGKRSRFIAASIDTYATAVAVAVALNAGRGQYVWHYNAFETPAIIAAAAAAELAEAYERTPAFNTSGLKIAGILPQLVDADRPTATEMNNALNNGMTVLSDVSGEVRITRSVTTQSLDDSSNPDYRVIDTHFVEVADAVADDIEINFASEFGEALLVPDIEGQMPEPGEVSPLTGKDFIVNRLNVYGPGGAGNRLLAVVDSDIVLTEIDDATPTKMNGVIPINPVELFIQGAFDVRQI